MSNADRPAPQPDNLPFLAKFALSFIGLALLAAWLLGIAIMTIHALDGGSNWWGVAAVVLFIIPFALWCATDID